MKETKLAELMQQMTTEEKIGQLTQIKGDAFFSHQPNTGPKTHDLALTENQLWQVGSLLNVAGYQKVKQIQDAYLAHSRLSIPLLFMGDVIHGYQTVFPIPLLQGCSWNPELVAKCAYISALESGYAGIQVNFSPMVDLVRDSRWGRVLEATGGEDPYLASLYGASMVEAYHQAGMACCAKHFIAYGAVESGMDYQFVDISRRELFSYYLPPFQSCIQAGVDLVMTAFTTFEGIPCTVHPWLLNALLRQKLDFQGILISDYSSLVETIAHGYSSSSKEAAFYGISSTLDIEMMSDCYLSSLSFLFDSGFVNKKLLDESVWRILSLKNRLGLFENPYGLANEEKEKHFILSAENLKTARLFSSESFVLLENKHHLLPLTSQSKIALIGPYADNQGISGAWSIYNEKNQNTVTIKQAFLERNLDFLYAKGSSVLPEEEINFILSMEGNSPISPSPSSTLQEMQQEAIEVANQSDVIVLALGEHYKQSGEGASRSMIDLPSIQLDLLRLLSSLGKPIVVLLFSGRPLALKEVVPYLDALLWVGFPGTEGGHAIGDVLFGDVNPSGRLTMSFPQTTGQNPLYYNHYSTGRPADQHSPYRYTARFQDIPPKPFYPFGYGLSYAEFEYKALTLSKTTLSLDLEKNDSLTVSITVKNSSSIAGKETIQLYIQDCFASVVRPVKELKHFQKVYFAPDEEKKISFTVTLSDLMFWNQDLAYIVEPGEFKVFVGRNSEDTLEAKFVVSPMSN